MQRTFTIEYLVTSNATAAARTAGYASPEKQGSRLLTYPKIQAAISDYFFGPEMDAREVIQRLGQQARAEWTEYLRPDGTIDVDQMEADGRKYLVNGVRPSKEGPVYEFPDQQKALVDIGRYHKLFTDGVDVTSGEKPVPFADIVAAMQRARKAGVDE
jgi:hypothetical protein